MKAKTWAWALGGFVALIAIGEIVGPPPPVASSAQEKPAEKPAARDHSIPQPWPDMMGERVVGMFLKDPSSARYQNLTYRTRGPLGVVCGEVNARNSFGGYTGFKDFIAIADHSVTFEDGSVRFVRRWNKLCVRTDADDARHAD